MLSKLIWLILILRAIISTIYDTCIKYLIIISINIPFVYYCKIITVKFTLYSSDLMRILNYTFSK